MPTKTHENKKMRFNKIETFKIEDLLLDEGNYRFLEAGDQKACVQKIYNINPAYFKGLMEGIAEHDLGEPLLVYRNGKKNIVSDGNRRLSALKVLYNDDYAPTDAIKQHAKELRAAHTIDFKKIQAQVSEDKALVSLTVYERHSTGTGATRVPWTAYAKARYGFDEKLGEHKAWRIMALLSEVEQKQPSITSFTRGSDFSYEVFRILIRGAIKLGIISENIFSARGESIKKTARKDLIKDAVSKAHKFLLIMKKKEITLSRKDGSIYANPDNVEIYLLENFSLSPDNQELEDAKASGESTEEDDGDAVGEGGGTGEGSGTEKTDAQGNPTGGSNDNPDPDQDDDDGDEETGNHRIQESSKILKKLKKLKSKKLNGLYYSLCTVSLNKHPALMYVGAWSFFEVLSKFIGNKNDEFPGFYKSKSKALGFDKNKTKDFGVVLTDISNYGNATKHSKNATPLSANQLNNHFEVLEPLILAVLDQAISEEKKRAA